MNKTNEKTKKVSKEKIETVKKLVELIKTSNTLIIASIKNLPSRQFQQIRKKLKEKAQMKVVKKNIMLKAIESSGKTGIEKLKDYVCEDSTILFSKEDAFEVAGILAENKNAIKAKPEQIAIDDIVVEEGPTELTPGPAITELGSLGLKISVEEGKIAIKEKKIIVKKGDKISEAAASVMGKLEILPFKIGLEPIAIYDLNANKIYTDVKIDPEKTAEELKTSAAKALGFAQKIMYISKDTIGFLIAKASAEERTLEKLFKEPVQENKPQEVK